MARLYPFRALRYDDQRVNLADVVTQPYDKISPQMQESYYRKSPYNLIRVVLGKREPGDTDSDNVYTRAAEHFSAWRREGVLQQDDELSLYGYSQTYPVPGTDELRERRGFIALGQLYDYADQVVYRHEQTFPKHKSDRLALFKALRAYPEQIYMLYSDPTFTAEHLLFDTADGKPRPADLAIVDEYGVTHRLWQLTNTVLIGKILKNMSDKKLIIADGHHRYETSVAYMHERAQQLGLETDGTPPASAPAEMPATAFPEAAMMMTFVNMDAPGISILPTHRVVYGLPSFSATQFARNAQQLFDVEVIPDVREGHFPGAQALLQRLAETPGVAFIAATREGDFLLRPKPEAVQELLAGLSPRQAALDVVQLHKIALEQLLHLDEAKVRAGDHVRYLREAPDALEQVACGNADVAFLTKPVTLEQIKDVALHLEVMPQKSTDFYPKLLSGLAMYTLE